MGKMRGKQFSDAELKHALERLQGMGELGLSRHDFEALFGSDRQGRALMAELRKRGIAAVVVTKRGDKDVYRVAKTYDEVRGYVNSLKSRITELEDAIQGIQAAWHNGGVKEAQRELL